MDKSASPSNLSEAEVEPVRISKFEDANLKESLLRGIYAYGWQTPSSIQQTGIPAILTGRDVILQAESGKGKTGTFGVSLLQMITESQPDIQGAILVPTRELADQVCNVIKALGDHLQINCLKCVGQCRVNTNLLYPDRATILVGTPGKLEAVISRGLIRSQPLNLRYFIIDEFDKILDNHEFVEVVNNLFKYLQNTTQVVFCSATINRHVMDMTRHYLRNPIDIAIKNEDLTLEGISQFYIDCKRREYKFDTLLDLYQSLVVAQTIIYVNSKRECDELIHNLHKQDFAVEGLHGGMEQSARDRIIEEFRHGQIRILISTDLTARGIDIASINVVICYSLPFDNAQYIHRIGRAGRYGKKGLAINLLGEPADYDRLQEIERYYNTQIKELPSDFIGLLN